jgi:putative SOS response-associated peptidase YedK
MPVVIPPDRWAEWLGERPVPAGELNGLLAPYPDNAMAFWAVDRRVGNAKNDSPDLFTPLSTACPIGH